MHGRRLAQKADEWLSEEHASFLVGPRAHVSATSREADLKFPWLDRTPGGRYGPGFCPERAGELLTPIELEMAGTEQGYDMLLRDYPIFGYAEIVDNPRKFVK